MQGCWNGCGAKKHHKHCDFSSKLCPHQKVLDPERGVLDILNTPNSVSRCTWQVNLKAFFLKKALTLKLKIKHQAVFKIFCVFFYDFDDLLNIFHILKKVSSCPTRLWGPTVVVLEEKMKFKCPENLNDPPNSQ